MSRFVRDTAVKLAQCPRCGAYVFLAESSGFRAAVDPAPASRDAYIATLTAGRRSFDLLEASGRPYKLLGRRLASPAPTFDPAGAQTAAEGRRKVLVEHPCGAHAKSMQLHETEEEEAAGPKVPATHGAASAGSRPGTAPASASTPSFPAGRATHHRSKRCSICDQPVKSGQAYVSIECGEFIWAAHEECE